VKKLGIHFWGWGLDYPLGLLAEAAGTIVFEFSREAREHGYELSPFHHPLAPGAPISRPARSTRPIAGFLDDALPDGWGRLLVDRALAARGHDIAQISVLDRLAVVGNQAIGALRFEPPEGSLEGRRDLDAMALAREVKLIQADQPSRFLPELLQAGSPQGARPKAMVWLDRRNQAMSTQPFAGAEPWLVKFPGPGESIHAPAIEKVYGLLAKASGLAVPESLWLSLQEMDSAAFAVARFDRRGGMRIPVLSFAALLDADFRSTYTDYQNLVRMVRQLTRDERQVAEFFRRCVFNVVFNNRDDHLKNFAMILQADRSWALAPAFDISFAEGPGYEHTTSVGGSGGGITRAMLLGVASAGALKKARAEEIIDQVLQGTGQWRRLAIKHDIARDEWQHIEARIQRNAKLCLKSAA
jgi:serine/threonine-protein kinase HipA